MKKPYLEIMTNCSSISRKDIIQSLEDRINIEKMAIILDKRFVGELDRLVEENVFLSRSQAIREAVSEKLMRMKKTRLAKECSKLDSEIERTMAEEGLIEDLKQWPEY